ncbi:hypothetical protein MD484_g1592, partial [Candolleomyces efflorescens]
MDVRDVFLTGPTTTPSERLPPIMKITDEFPVSPGESATGGVFRDACAYGRFVVIGFVIDVGIVFSVGSTSIHGTANSSTSIRTRTRTGAAHHISLDVTYTIPKEEVMVLPV